MLEIAAAMLLKLLCGVVAFAVIGYSAQTGNPRLSGILLTFPVLNGIGLLTATENDPNVMANSIYPTAAVNALLFLGATYLVEMQSSRSLASRSPRLFKFTVLLIYGALWLLTADFVGSAASWYFIPLFAGYVGVAVFSLFQFGATPQATVQRSSTKDGLGKYVYNRIGLLVVFGLTLVIVLVAPYLWDSVWVGKLSALPLPGAFALAGIAIDQPSALKPIRSTVLLGPFVAMAFAWIYSLVIVHLRPEPTAAYWGIGGITLALGWTVAFFAVLGALPVLEKVLVGRTPKQKSE